MGTSPHASSVFVNCAASTRARRVPDDGEQGGVVPIVHVGWV